jgi:hypothetical protein
MSATSSGIFSFILDRPDTGTDLCATVTAIQRNEGCGYHCHTSLDERLHPMGPWGAFFDTCLMMRAVDRTCKSRCFFYLKCWRDGLSLFDCNFLPKVRLPLSRPYVRICMVSIEEDNKPRTEDVIRRSFRLVLQTACVQTIRLLEPEESVALCRRDPNRCQKKCPPPLSSLAKDFSWQCYSIVLFDSLFIGWPISSLLFSHLNHFNRFDTDNILGSLCCS